MKKTILASAIAAATFSGAALAQESNLPTVYGNIQYALTHTNVDGGGSQVDHFDNGTTLGLKHDHEIAPGITGFMKLELEGILADDKAETGEYNQNGINALDEAYVGIKGDSFGQVWIGSDDSTYESAINEVYNFFEVGTGIRGAYETGEGDLIQYKSPSFGGLTLGGAVQVNGDAKGDKSYPFQLAAIYEVDALELAFAIDSNDAAEGDNENSYGLRASYNLDNLRLTGSYETRKDNEDVFSAMGVYTMGANQFALAYQLVDEDVSGDSKSDTLTLQALRNVSDNLYVYVEGYFSTADAKNEYTLEGGSGDEKTVAAVGLNYYF